MNLSQDSAIIIRIQDTGFTSIVRILARFGMPAKSAIKNCVNAGLRPLDMQLVRGRSSDPAVQTFLSARKTIAAANRAGLSVADYIDQRNATPGATASTVEFILRVAGLTGHVDRVCEIGPGTGRFAERVIAALHPDVYEIYETASLDLS